MDHVAISGRIHAMSLVAATAKSLFRPNQVASYISDVIYKTNKVYG